MFQNNFFKVTDLPSAVLNVKDDRVTPEQMTVCSTIYIDMDDCDGLSFGTRIFPLFSFPNQDGKPGMSFFLDQWGAQNRFILNMGTIDQTRDISPNKIGKLQFRINIQNYNSFLQNKNK